MCLSNTQSTGSTDQKALDHIMRIILCGIFESEPFILQQHNRNRSAQSPNKVFPVCSFRWFFSGLSFFLLLLFVLVFVCFCQELGGLGPHAKKNRRKYEFPYAFRIKCIAWRACCSRLSWCNKNNWTKLATSISVFSRCRMQWTNK